MKKRKRWQPKREVLSAIKRRGYKPTHADDPWRPYHPDVRFNMDTERVEWPNDDQIWMARYHRRDKAFYLITVGRCTGMSIVEVLCVSEVFDVFDNV